MTNNNEILTYITQSFDLKRQGYYKQAIEMLYKALAIEGNNVEILSQLADLYFCWVMMKEFVNIQKKLWI